MSLEQYAKNQKEPHASYCLPLSETIQDLLRSVLREYVAKLSSGKTLGQVKTELDNRLLSRLGVPSGSGS
jgi:hypothetical protein